MELSNLKDSGGIVWAIPLISLMINISSKIVKENLDDRDKKDQYYCLESELLEDIPLDNIHEKTLEKLEKIAKDLINSEDFKRLVNDVSKNYKRKA
ncbi:3588_t:CDS:1, partial [Gigaspora margarita]